LEAGRTETPEERTPAAAGMRFMTP